MRLETFSHTLYLLLIINYWQAFYQLVVTLYAFDHVVLSAVLFLLHSDLHLWISLDPFFYLF